MIILGTTKQRTMPRARSILVKGQELLELSTCRDFFRCGSLVRDLLPLPCAPAEVASARNSFPHGDYGRIVKE